MGWCLVVMLTTIVGTRVSSASTSVRKRHGPHRLARLLSRFRDVLSRGPISMVVVRLARSISTNVRQVVAVARRAISGCY